VNNYFRSGCVLIKKSSLLSFLLTLTFSPHSSHTRRHREDRFSCECLSGCLSRLRRHWGVYTHICSAREPQALERNKKRRVSTYVNEKWNSERNSRTNHDVKMCRKPTRKEEWQKRRTTIFDIYSLNREEQIIKDPSLVTCREENHQKRIIMIDRTQLLISPTNMSTR
jgi:hypothetical protein